MESSPGPRGTSTSSPSLLFIADGEPEQGPLHTSFSLSKDGETLVLYDVDARGNQVIDQVSVEAMAPDASPENTSAARSLKI